MAEEGGVGPVILEDYFMSDEEILLDKTPEDDEIDLYNNMTFTSSAYQDESEVKTLAADSEEAPVNGFEEPAAPGEEAGPSEMAEEQLMLEDVSEDESRHSEPQLADEAAEETEEEEMETAEQEEDHTSEEAEEQNDLGDPAVIRAVRGRFAFEPRLITLRPLQNRSGLVELWRLRRGSSTRICDGAWFLRQWTLKPFLSFMRPQSPMMPGSMRSPYPFTPPRRTRRVFSLNRTSGYTSFARTLFPYINSPTWSLSRSFDPLLFSPSANSQQKFRKDGSRFSRFPSRPLFLHSLPSAMTQLHPLHQRILTQRQKRGRERRIPCMDPQPPEMDPYAALMTTLEKDWVIKVQMMQLQSESPQRDDYYYQEYYRKLEHKKAQKELLGGCKLEVPKLTTPYIRKVETYESVVRIPGSLGQVAVSTCYSPRRAIDAVHHIPPEQAVGNQRLQVLYQIEKMFLQLLDIEDTQRKLVLAPEKQHSHFYEKLAHELGHIYQSLRIEECNNEEETKGTFLQILLVGKGKKLVARLLPHLSPEQAKQVLITITQNLSFLIKKDLLDETLPVLYSPLGEVVEQLTFSEMVDILQELSRLQPDSVNQSLATIFGNKFAVSLLYLLLSHGERCLSSGMPLEPQSGDFEKWVDTVLLVARELSQVSKESMVEPLHMPSNLLFLFCRYVDKETVNRLDVKME
uniref:Uncharacterized protein n=1 Tax=Sphaerodactylus townsendi TaxID=933632 RepID=A0ACB8E480_9SAUR